MRAQVVQVDQQLRLVSSPAYSPLDRDKALAEQNVSGFFFISFFIPPTFFFKNGFSTNGAKVQSSSLFIRLLPSSDDHCNYYIV